MTALTVHSATDQVAALSRSLTSQLEALTTSLQAGSTEQASIRTATAAELAESLAGRLDALLRALTS
jgi:predicted translin family RNA/ssDNA-binding protein